MTKLVNTLEHLPLGMWERGRPSAIARQREGFSGIFLSGDSHHQRPLVGSALENEQINKCRIEGGRTDEIDCYYDKQGHFECPVGHLAKMASFIFNS